MQNGSADGGGVIVSEAAAPHDRRLGFCDATNGQARRESAQKVMDLFRHLRVGTFFRIVGSLRTVEGCDEIGTQRKHLRDHAVSLAISTVGAQRLVLFDTEPRLPHEDHQRIDADAVAVHGKNYRTDSRRSQPRLQSTRLIEDQLDWTDGVRLARAIPARLGGLEALIVDLDVDRALVDHDDPIQVGETKRLVFQFEDELLAFSASVHTRAPRLLLGRTLWRSVMTLSDGEKDSDLRLAESVSRHSSRVLQALEANATGSREDNRLDGDATITTLGAAARFGGLSFVTYRYDGSSWSKRSSLLAEQPEEGFTISSFEDAAQVEELCRAYEQADPEARKLIRMMAELSVNG